MAMIVEGRGTKAAPKKNPADIPGTPEYNARQAAAWAARYQGQAAKQQAVYVPPPAPAPKPAPTYSSKASSSKKSGGRAAASSGGGGGGGGSYADGYAKAQADFDAKKSNDAPQVAALRQMIDGGFATARDQKLQNILGQLSQQDSIILSDYLKRALQLDESRADNEKSEHDASFSNIANRARERGDILTQAASMGAGESDTLRSTLAALRNWSQNQSDVNRSFFDTQRSINSAVTDLNSDTRTARANLHGQALSDQEQIWANYYNQRADALTQIGNIEGNKTSDSYKEGGGAFAEAAKAASESWKSPGISADVMNWQGSSQAQEKQLNNAAAEAAVTNLGAPKKPEGATLRKW